MREPIVPSVLAVDRVEPDDRLSRYAPVYVLFPPGRAGDVWPSQGRRNDYQPVPVGRFLDEAIATARRSRWRRLRGMSPRDAWALYGMDTADREHAIYGRELRTDRETILQYYAFYPYNDASQRHESDWEVVTVFLPDHDVVYSVHERALSRAWHRVTRFDDQGRIDPEGGTHPLVYVALGSHAQYFDARGIEPVVRLEPEALPPINRRYRLIRLPEGVTPDTPAAALEGDFRWLTWPGRWGRGGAPLGPVFGDAWRPRAWADARAALDDGTDPR